MKHRSNQGNYRASQSKIDNGRIPGHNVGGGGHYIKKKYPHLSQKSYYNPKGRHTKMNAMAYYSFNRSLGKNLAAATHLSTLAKISEVSEVQINLPNIYLSAYVNTATQHNL